MGKKETNSEQIQEAHNLRSIIESGFKNYESGTHYSYQSIGAALAKMRDGKAYKLLGYTTMDAVIKDIGKSRSICYSMMDYNDVVTPFITDHPELVNINVTDICKYVIPWLRNGYKHKMTMEEMIAKVLEIASLPATEMEDEIGRLRGKTVKVDCAHETTEAWVKCTCCNKFIKVH
jgi:hypothetical protein